jgi:hypothetical protein
VKAVARLVIGLANTARPRAVMRIGASRRVVSSS